MSEITMPRLSDTMEDGVVAGWLKQPGDRVATGDALAEIETDKAIMELEAYEDGVLERILVQAGDRVPIGTAIGILGDGTGTSPEPTPAPAILDEPAGQADSARPEPETAPVGPATGAPADPLPAARDEGPPRDQRFKASPLARRLAKERGVDLASVRGTGPGGRITRTDIDAATPTPTTPTPTTTTQTTTAPPAASAGAPNAATTPGAPTAVADSATLPTAPTADVDEIPLTRVQRIAAARLTKAKQDAPHIYLTSAVDVTELLALRKDLNAAVAATGGPKISVNDLVVKATANALRARPEVNVSFAGDVLRRHRGVHLGIAVATPAGLMVPVIHDADRRTISEIAAESQAKAAKARDGKLRLPDVSGGTFTVSNLGMFGLEQFTAVINPPEAAILAVGAATEEFRPVDGQPVLRSILRLTLSCDHRAIDGAVGAAFLQHLTRLLEHPLLLLA
ncbi:dihydrolipoamide acetyltransferase family protein [Pseudonocardia eucalypti]|uniref:Dihydrolipoamide acetyltransferase component of pyruvate dehydrogenase complex n=1 Tax=Pseudonocardia eucalypti TaxID=648755 RepID=A0ABP9QLG6_9PSEU|nr:pyruvate dehydrogenase E2 component (dihydrolipoamide acetyltransferase) [Pseudonocardia eucalypti]